MELRFKDDDARNLIDCYSKIVTRCDVLYYNYGVSEYTDRDYDFYKSELIELERQHPELHRPNSPSQTVGVPPSVNTVPHYSPMLSLRSVNAIPDLFAWLDKMKQDKMSLEYKCDGVSCSLSYMGGKLIVAVTRGDGEYGTVVTDLVKQMCVPLELTGITLTSPYPVEVRGELVLTTSLDEINRTRKEEGLPPYNSSRNLVAGVLNSKEVDPDLLAQISFIAFDIVNVYGCVIYTREDIFEILKGWDFITASIGITPTDNSRVSRDGLKDLIMSIERVRPQLPYDIDGLVFKINDLHQYTCCGTTEHHPNGALAFKFTNQRASTKLLDISWSISKTGVLTPVAEIEPVDILGARITNVNLHNYERINQLGLGLSDIVTVERAGDVIPSITEVVTKSEVPSPIVIPTSCGWCGSKIDDTDLKRIRCSNTAKCPGTQLKVIEHFCSKAGMDIKGLSGSTIRKLMDKGYVNTCFDIYKLQPEQIASLDGFSKSSGTKLCRCIEESKSARLSMVLSALAIPSLGRAACRRMSKEIPDLRGLTRLTYEEINELNFLGDKSKEYLKEWLLVEDNRKLINALADAGVGCSN